MEIVRWIFGASVSLIGLTPFGAVQDGASAVARLDVAREVRVEVPPEGSRSLTRPDGNPSHRKDRGPASLHVAHLTMPTPRRFVKQPHSSKQFQYVRKTTRLRCGFRCPYFRTLLDPEMKEIGI